MKNNGKEKTSNELYPLIKEGNVKVIDVRSKKNRMKDIFMMQYILLWVFYLNG
jgi:hypothetical protein